MKLKVWHFHCKEIKIDNINKYLLSILNFYSISSRQNYDLTNGRKPLRDFIQWDQALVGLGAMKSPMSNKSIDRKFAQDFKIHKGRNYNQSNRNMIIKKESKQKAANSLKDILSSISTTKNKL